MYPFQNLWLFIDDEQPFGPLLRDTIECMLANDYGKWLGKGVSIYETSFLIKKAYYFPIEGEYTFSLRQGMRAKSIPGIEEVGLRVEKHNGFTEPSLCVKPQEYKKQNRKAPKRRTSIAEEGQGNSYDRRQTGHHTKC